MSGPPHAIILTDFDALLVTDVQNDFLPGGKLAVPRGDRVISPINRLIALFMKNMLPIFATRDWHPKNHCSFKEQGGPWPSHCIAGTNGAKFSTRLQLPDAVKIVSKATRPEAEAYSSFEGTDLFCRLKNARIKRIFIVGLATDYCVHDSAKDAAQLGLNPVVLTDAIASISQDEETINRALSDIEGAGAQLARTNDIVGYDEMIKPFSYAA
jgi:nicotinamidase/pyrazinamidase